MAFWTRGGTTGNANGNGAHGSPGSAAPSLPALLASDVGRAAASVGPDDRAVRVGDQQLRLSTDDEAGIR